MCFLNLTAWKCGSRNSSNHRKSLARNSWRWLGGGLLVLVVMVAPVSAQKPNKPLDVATGLATPFVFEENGQLTGFSIDLWHRITDEMDVKSELFVNPTTQALLSAVKSHKADVGIGNISITAEREKDFDFSQPIFESGLQILVRDQSSGGTVPGLLAVISPAFVQLIGIILVIILVPAHIIWFFERRRGGIIPTLSYFPGIFKACWWALATLATQADEMPKSVGGRIVAVIWMFTSVVFVAYFTAAVTTSLTVQQLRSNIKGPDDLAGKRVATAISSTSAIYLHQQQNIQVLEFRRLAEAYQALLQGQADAVVFDAPVLLYYASHEGKGRVQVAGTVFRKENYGIIFPTDSPYRKPINEALLTLRENGTYQELYQKWFSSK